LRQERFDHRRNLFSSALIGLGASAVLSGYILWRSVGLQVTYE
jgi:hypothetical protein